MEEDILQFDEAALCLFHRLQTLYEDAHVWFQNSYSDTTTPDNTKFLRLQDIAFERDQVSIALWEHITYVLMPDGQYKLGTPGIKLGIAFFIRFNVRQMNRQRSVEESRKHLHDTLRTLRLIF